MVSANLSAVEAKLQNFHRNGKGWTALCPAHDDTRNSLSIGEGNDGRILLHCHAGCAPEAIVGKLGLTMADLMPPRESTSALKKQIKCIYDYRDENGTLLSQAVRHQPKGFAQRRPDGRGGWVWNMEGVRRVPYRLPELLAAPANEWVFVVEGEKDADSLNTLGLIATCNAGGAGKWTRDHAQHLAGRKVIIIPDNDEAGRKHGQIVGESLQGIAAEVRWLELLGVAAKGDVSDWLGFGGTKQQLMALADAALAWTPALPAQMPAPRMPTADEIHNTDTGNAKRMAAACADRLVYVKEFERWHVWAGTHWQEDNTFGAMRLAKQTVAGMYAEAAHIENDHARREFVKWVMQSEGERRLAAMIALLKSEPGFTISSERLDQHPMYLACTNGTLDLATGDLIAPTPAHLITKRVEVAYDPAAECPLWEAFLSRIMGKNIEMIAFLQRLIGHALTGDATGKYFVFMYGPKGNNGKSTLVETIMRLLGPLALKSPVKLVMMRDKNDIPNDIARLRGVRFTVTNEVDGEMKFSENTIKDLTGNDTLSARFMRGEFFDITPTHKLWIYGNHKPEISGTDAALWDRVKLVPFDVEIPVSERDPHFADKLAAELPGILAWAVRGCLSWQKYGIATPPAVIAATHAYRVEQDAIGRFVEECCETGRDFAAPAGQLFQAYEGWCKQEGNKPVTGTKFGAELGRRGFEGRRAPSGSGNLRVGLQLTSGGRMFIPAPQLHWSADR